MILKRILTLLSALCILLGVLPMSVAAVDMIEPADGNFTLLWVTDPQIYTNKYPEILSAQNDWILANANRLKVKYAIHTGDLVHYDSNDAQWQFVSKEYKKWDDAGFAYGVLAGNHDMTGSDYSNYANYFGASRYNNTETNWWYGGDYKNNYGHYDLRSTGGANFVFVYLSYGDHSAEDLAWVNSVFAAYPNRIGVLAVHDYMATGGGRSERGELLFNEVVLKNPNVRMVLCGHNYNSNRTVDEIDDNGDGKADRSVYQIMANYQYASSNGGNGFIRFMECDVANGTITHRTYSPYTASFGSDYEDGKIFDEFGTRDAFVTPFDFSDPVAKGANDPAYGTVVYSSELSFAPTDSDERLTLPVAYQNKAEAGNVYRGVGVYDRFFSLDAADACSDPTAVNYVVTAYTGASGHTIKQVIRGSSLGNADVRVPIPQNGAVLVLPSTVSLDRLTVGRTVILRKMRELTTPSSMYATNITVPSWGGVYNISGINREAGNGEWVLYDALSTVSSSHEHDLLFAFSPVSGSTYRLTASATALGEAKSLAVPTGGFVLAVNTCYAKPTLVQSVCSRFTSGLQITLNGHTAGVTPQYVTKSLLAPSVNSYTRDSTIVVTQSGTSHVFYNTDGLYPKADYTYSPSVTADPSSMVLYYDYLLEAGLNTNITLYFNNGSVLVHHYFEGGSINAKSGDLEGDNVRRTGKIDLASMNIPDECFNSDGTLTLKKIRVYASGAASKKLYLHSLALTTDRSPVGGAVIPQSVPLLGKDCAVLTPSATGGYVYDNGTLTVSSEAADGYAVALTLEKPVCITSLKNLLVDVTSSAPFDIQLSVTTSADDARYGLVSEFWPNLCEALDNGYIPAGSYRGAFDLHSCFAWNKVVPADGMTTVKQIKFVLNGAGTLQVKALQLSNTTAFGRFEDGQYQAGSTPSSALTSDVYTVTDTHIDGVAAGTTVSQLTANLNTVASVTVLDNGEAVSPSAVVTTGMTLSDGHTTRTLVVTGDLTGDGRVNTTDARMVLMYALRGTDADDTAKLASDYDRNGIINTGDVRDMLRASLLG
ncbi:MAG: metallophosphoesterase [Clostridia bacterium]|nr:metallophosphoesterase [Clostridia bacterium]